MGGLPLFLGGRLRLLKVDENALLVSQDNIGEPIAIDIPGHNLRAHAGIIIDAMRDEVHAPRLAREFKPIQHRLIVAVGIPHPAMRPKAFPSHNVLQTIAIHINEIDGVEF